ncbi:SAV_2336 N-terminal domain-related protein [Nostoc sp. C110]|uniref:SAV_2336 N-terminal domain-related protein n=1 Tax=Nostoc sp. C110 TaxID=3349876 RepID=UPI00370DDD26
MITKLIACLEEVGLEVNAEEIGDILWLANQMQQVAPEPGQTEQPHEKPIQPSTPISPSSGNAASTESSSSIPLKREPTVSAYSSDVIPDSGSSGESSPTPEGLPFKAPAAPALRNSLALARALRPLMRKVPSRIEFVLDEESTARQIAEYQFWSPVLQPAKERWLELVLVVEETSTTIVWQETIAEFQKLMERHGAFRNVYTWSLQTKTDGTPQIFPFQQKITGKQRSHSPKELLDATGRRLILLISDCISPLWWQGEIHNLLEIWGNHVPVAVLQLLPEQLWERTVLGLGNSVSLGTIAPGVLNSQLVVSGLPIWLEEKPKMALQFPVVTLEPESLTEWARVVAGAGSVQRLGVLFQKNWQELIPKFQSPTSQPLLNPELLIKRFHATASPLAKRLAGFMAAAPVSLPVINLIQQELLPESRQIHLAEIFMSGLLQLIEGDKQIQVSRWQYKFVEGVREILLGSVKITEIDDVLEKISQYIARKTGLQIKSFAALLTPNPDWDITVQKEVIPFAKIAIQVLRYLGEDYAALVEQLQQKPPVLTEDSEVIPNFPAIQTFDFKVKTIALVDEIEPFNLQAFEFDVALIEVNQSAQITTDNPLEIADEIIFIKTAKHLNDTEQLLIQGILANQTYEQIAALAEYSVRHLKNVAIKLWEVLSEVVGEKVTKKNLKTVLERLAAGRHLTINRHHQQSQYFVEELGNGVGLEMVSIPEGSLMMGAAKNEEASSDDERPQHKVTVSTFFMGKYPLTQEQWEAVAALPQINQELNPDPSNFKGANRPVETVSWYDAVEFCDRLSQYTGKTYRLPSEAEWEYACRAGTTTPFHFGETITSELANYNASRVYRRGVKGTYRVETTPVGSFEIANTFGLYDMHGNVWEWCLDDWHSNYKGAPTDGNPWFHNNNNLYRKQGSAVLRGGSWYYYPENCRSASRSNYGRRDNRNDNIGFRVVCAVERII